MGWRDYLGIGPGVRLNLSQVQDASSVSSVANPPAMFEMRASREPFLNMATGQGTDRDPDSSEQPRWNFEPLRREYLESVYRMDGLARRVIEIPPDDALQNGAESWTVLDHSENPQPLSDVAALDDLHVKIHLADVCARWKGDSAIFMCIEESGTFEEAQQALPLELDRVTGLRDLVVLEKADLRPAVYQRELGAEDGPSIGEVILWDVTVRRPGGMMLVLRVHSSRLVMFHGAHIGTCPNISTTDGWGHDSVLEGAVRALMGIHTGRRGRSKIFNKIMTWFATTSFPKGQANTKTNAPDIMESLKSRWSLLRIMTSLGVGLLNEGETIQQLTAPVGGVAELSDAQIKDLALATGIPVGRWLGEIGGWSNGESYKADWRATIASYMKRRYERPLRRIYEVAYAAVGEVPAFDIVFSPLEVMDHIQSAEERLLLLQGDQIAADLYPAMKPALVRSRAYSGWQRTVQPMTEDEIAAYEDGLEPEDLDLIDDPTLADDPDPENEDVLEGDAGTRVTVPLAVRRKARLGLKLSRLFKRGGTAVGKQSARLLASGSFPVSRLPRLTSFFDRHDIQIRRNNERSSAGWGPKDPSARYIAWLLWGGDEGWAWAKRERARLERVTEDADFSDAALLAFELGDDDLVTWRALRDQAAEIVALEGHADGDPMLEDAHLTLVYFGTVKKGSKADAAKDFINAFASVAAPEPEVLGVRLFPAQADGRCPVVIEFKPKGLSGLYRRALVALVSHVTATQFPKYRPHVTLGYARPNEEERKLLEALDVPPFHPLPELTLTWQGNPAVHLPLE